MRSGAMRLQIPDFLSDGDSSVYMFEPMSKKLIENLRHHRVVEKTVLKPFDSEYQTFLKVVRSILCASSYRVRENHIVNF